MEFAKISNQTKSIYSEENILLPDLLSIHMKSFLQPYKLRLHERQESDENRSWADPKAFIIWIKERRLDHTNSFLVVLFHAE